MRDENLHSFIPLAEAMRSLGLVYGARGITALRKGAGGETDVAGAIESYLWCIRLLVRSYYPAFAQQQIHRSLLLRRLPLSLCLLCHYIAGGDDARQNELWALLQKPLFDNDSRVDSWWYERQFEPFFISLYGKARGHQLPLEPGRLELGVYGPILDQWEDDRAVATSLQAACDYHLKVMNNTRDRDAEFDMQPFDLVPVEILATIKLRAVTGLQPITVNHPLMQTFGPIATASPPDELQEIFGQVREKYDAFFGRTI